MKQILQNLEFSEIIVCLFVIWDELASGASQIVRNKIDSKAMQGKARPPSEAVAAVLADPRLLDPLRGGEAGQWVVGGGGASWL